MAGARELYVSGLAESVSEDVLRAAFLPFGEIRTLSVPTDHATGQHKGFAFVMFESLDDAAAAIDNMHDNELMGRTLKVNFATERR